MKKMMLFSLGLLVGGMHASEFEQVVSENVREITYTITIRRADDEQYNKAQWVELVKNTASIVKKAQADEQNSATLGEMIQGLCKAIEIVGTASKNNTGIHGEMQISISDDVQDEKKCGKCPCTKYKGVCPCIQKVQPSAESIRTVCTEQCQKTGCTQQTCAQNGCVQGCNC